MLTLDTEEEKSLQSVTSNTIMRLTLHRLTLDPATQNLRDAELKADCAKFTKLKVNHIDTHFLMCESL